MLQADSLVFADCNNDIVVVRNPNPITNSILTDVTNKDNGRDQVNAFTDGDVHFYWVYEGCSGTVKTRSSNRGPTLGPNMPACETHWTYSHSAYYDGQTMPKITVRGRRVQFDCGRLIATVSAFSCETRVSLVTCVPFAATRFYGWTRLDSATTGGDQLLLGVRTNCVAWIFDAAAGGIFQNSTFELPNLNQELFVRVATLGTAIASVWLVGYDVPNGEG